MKKVLEAIDLGNAAVQRSDFDPACQYFYSAARQLLLLSRQNHGESQFRQLQQAMKLMRHVQKIKNNTGEWISPSTASDSTSDSDSDVSSSASRLTFNDVIGADEAIRFLKAKVIHPLKYPQQAARFKQKAGGGVLLYGPPGTGKTLLVKALSNELKAPIFAVKPSDILGKYVGESEKNMAELFSKARAHPLSIIFVDEMDALAPQRGNDNNSVAERLVNQLLQELDGFNEQKNTLLFIGASNLPWKIDSAALRGARVDLMCYMGLPDSEGRLKLLDMYLKDIPLSTNIDLHNIAQQTDLFSPADIMTLCAQAAQAAFIDSIETGLERNVSEQDLLTAMVNIKPSATPELLHQYREFK